MLWLDRLPSRRVAGNVSLRTPRLSSDWLCVYNNPPIATTPDMSAKTPRHRLSDTAPIIAAFILLGALRGGGALAADPVPTIGWGDIAAVSLPEPLETSLDGLLTAALESTASVGVVKDPAGADLALAIEVKGRGPWQIRTQGTVKAAEGGKPRKFTARKVSFKDRAGLSAAVDALAADLHARWLGESSPAPVPLAAALSPSDEAVDSFLLALDALASGDVPAARAGLEKALALDPGFALAAAESAYLSIADGDQEASLTTLRGVDRVRQPASPLAAKAWGGLRSLLDVEYRMAGRGALAGRGAAKWDAVLKGLGGLLLDEPSGGVEKAWVLAVERDPKDPRSLQFLGIARMAIGEFGPAADAFGQAIALWPESMTSRALKAESHARIRQTAAARETLEAMKSWMGGAGVKPRSDAANPDLMLGSVELLEGHYDAALQVFEASLEALVAEGAELGATATLLKTVAQMRRDVVPSGDPLERDRQMERAHTALSRYEEALSAEERSARRNEILMLRGLVSTRAGDTVEAWKTVEQMTDAPVLDGAEGFEKVWLSGSIMLKEGDLAGAVSEFAKAASLENRVEDWIVLGQLQIQSKLFDDATASLAKAEEGLLTYRTPGPPNLEEGGLLLTDPYRAAMVPTYHYHRARLAYLTGDPDLSRRHFSMMLGYYRQADRRVSGMVKEALGRGAHPE